MTPDALAALHARSFTVPRPWSAAEFAALLRNPGVILATESDGFVLGRVVADEAELLTLAVAPGQRRTGIGRRLIDRFLLAAHAAGALRAFLEVSVENDAATRLYRAAGFVDAGRRPGYFQGPDGPAVDALILSCDLRGPDRLGPPPLS